MIWLLGDLPTATIQSKNYPGYRFGIRSHPSELYIVNDQIVSFVEVHPGLTGTGTVSFRSEEDGKYIATEKIDGYKYLLLKEFKPGQEFANSASFKIHPNKFFRVSTTWMQSWLRW